MRRARLLLLRAATALLLVSVVADGVGASEGLVVDTVDNGATAAFFVAASRSRNRGGEICGGAPQPPLPTQPAASPPSLGHRLGTARRFLFSPRDYAVLSPRPSFPIVSLRGAAAHPDDKDYYAPAVREFVTATRRSLKEGTFASFTLHGPTAKPPKKKKTKRRKTSGAASGVTDGEVSGHEKAGDEAASGELRIQNRKEVLRGRIRLVQGRLIALSGKRKKGTAAGRKGRGRKESSGGASAERLHVQATIKFHGATDVARNWKVVEPSGSGDDDVNEVEDGLLGLLGVRPGGDGGEMGGGGEDGEDGAREGDEYLGIHKGELVTTEGKWTLLRRGDGPVSTSQWRCQFRPATKKAEESAPAGGGQLAVGVAVAKHDRAKNVPLPSDAPFFRKLGVSDAQGRPRPGMESKLRQCQRFVEVVGGLVRGAIPPPPPTPSPGDDVRVGAGSGGNRTLSIVDMGCGRGYLTFALHSYLRGIYGAGGEGEGEGGGFVVESVGVELRPRLVREIDGVARSLGPRFDGLHFVEGTIENYSHRPSVATATTAPMEEKQEQEEEEEPRSTLDVLIALHACDTATDDALYFGITNRARVIVTAPCCHKEVRGQLDAHLASTGQAGTKRGAAAADRHPHPYRDVLRHPIYRERMAETVTDSARALLLEIAGYDVRVFEFVGGEHTAKNVMVAATLRRPASGGARLSGGRVTELRERLRSLAELHGIKRQRLALRLGESLICETNGDGVCVEDSNPALHRGAGRMPSL